MFDALYIGATGMQAQQLQVDTIANNLANVATTGFKKARVRFTDLVMQDASRQVTQTGEAGEAGPLASTPRLGAGVGVAQVGRVFDQGELKQTGAALDLAILGDGFLEVAMPDGSRAFTRGGSLAVGADGVLLSRSGFPLKPGVQVPTDATSLSITTDGVVRAEVPNRSGPVELGRLELVRFASPGALIAQGDDLYKASDASGAPIPAKAGQDGVGTLIQGSLEGSNVGMVDEMVELMIAQRAYEASLKVVQASDEMLGMVNALRK